FLRQAARGPETRKIANRLLVIVYSRLAVEAKAHPDGTAKDLILAWEREAARAEQHARQLPDDLPWFDSLVHEAERQAVGKHKQLQLVERLQALGRHGEAGKILQELAPKYPHDSWVHYLLGNSYGLQKKYKEAKNEYRIALKNQPNMVRPLYHLGLILLLQAEKGLPDRNQRATALQRLQQAEEYFHQVIQLKPDHALAHNSLGLCYELQQKPARALQAYRTALVCQPEHLQSRFKVAKLILQQG